jgi:hypothetical protein
VTAAAQEPHPVRGVAPFGFLGRSAILGDGSGAPAGLTAVHRAQVAGDEFDRGPFDQHQGGSDVRVYVGGWPRFV